MRFSITEVIDALYEGILTLHIPWTEVWRYAERQGVMPDHCPFIGIWPQRIETDVAATDGTYRGGTYLMVRVAEDASFGLDSGGMLTDALAEAALLRAEAVIDLVKQYALGVPNLPGVTVVVEGALYDIRGPLWVMDLTLKVEAL
jgi:hypothetical protein